MLRELLAGAAVSLVNFGIHAAMTGLIVIATQHTAAVTSHLGVFVRLTALLTITTATRADPAGAKAMGVTAGRAGGSRGGYRCFPRSPWWPWARRRTTRRRAKSP